MQRLCKAKFKYFGDNAEFRPGAYAVSCSKISIGKRVVLRPGTMLFADPTSEESGIVIEDDVLIGSGVHIINVNHKFSSADIPIIYQGHSASMQVILRKGCWIGACAVILPGVTIGENSVVGAGSVVTKTLPDRTIVAGNPAVVIRKL